MASISSPVVSRRIKNISSHDNPQLLTQSESSTIIGESSSGGGTVHDDLSNHFHSFYTKWQRRIPCLKRVKDHFMRIPPRIRMGFIFFWFCWKFVVVIGLLVVFIRSRSSHNVDVEESMSSRDQSPTTTTTTTTTKVLYIITTLAEYNTGSRATTKGQDRLGEILIPIMRDSIESMVSFDYQVDVFLICGYKLTAEREQFLRQALPAGVAFQFWDDAAPLGYDNRYSKDKIIPNTRALARQHRYVVKDKLFDYDMFLAFEDDMRITGHHVQHYMAMSEEIDRLRAQAPTTTTILDNENVEDYKQTKFYGQMTRQQLARVVPGFIRVEVLLNETEHGAQEQVLPIPLDYDFDFEQAADDGSIMQQQHHVDPEICCHVNMKPNIGTPVAPPASDLIIWETNIKAFQLRQLPPGGSNMLDWSVIMMGPGKHLDPLEHIGGYWSGREGAFGKNEKKPSGGEPTLIAQQGGWMATRDQIARMNSGLCMGSFLPPFDQPTYNSDGQESMNVEFWSGSYQFFTGVRGGCNMQRIISMHPDHFSKHLLYHVANNKQRQLSTDRMVRADHLFAQLNSIQKMAKIAKAAMEASKN